MKKIIDRVSVIIPTYNRAEDLQDCLLSVLTQEQKPLEVIIVDDSTNDEVRELINRIKLKFVSINCELIYIHNFRERSLTISRNIGIGIAKGEIILFLDSDVVLDSNYLQNIIDVFQANQNALGVQGLIKTNENPSRIREKIINTYNKIFLIQIIRKNSFKLLPSLGVMTSPDVDQLINCEWLSGANQSYRREILTKYFFDENLKKYSWGEDLDTSYRIFKNHPHSLYLTPNAKLIHRTSHEGRHIHKEVIYMDVIYLTYLFYKNIDQTMRNKIIYTWSRIGRVNSKWIFFIFNPSSRRLKEAVYSIQAVIFCIKHLKNLKVGDLSFFNNTIK